MERELSILTVIFYPEREYYRCTDSAYECGLDAKIQVYEIRQISGGGSSGINVNFNRLDNWQAFIGNDTALCLGADLLLTGALNGNGTFGNLPCSGEAPEPALHYLTHGLPVPEPVAFQYQYPQYFTE